MKATLKQIERLQIACQLEWNGRFPPEPEWYAGDALANFTSQQISEVITLVDRDTEHGYEDAYIALANNHSNFLDKELEKIGLEDFDDYVESRHNYYQDESSLETKCEGYQIVTDFLDLI